MTSEDWNIGRRPRIVRLRDIRRNFAALLALVMIVLALSIVTGAIDPSASTGYRPRLEPIVLPR